LIKPFDKTFDKMNATSKKLFCGHCKNMGKSEKEYTSHCAHKTQSQNSPLTCPELLKKVCNRCSSRNHTFDKCKFKYIVSPAEKISVAKPSVQTNKYSGLLDEDNDDDNKLPIFVFNMETLLSLNPSDQPEYIGEELYIRLVGQYNFYTGKIVGMLLQLDVSELIQLLENHVSLKERVDEAVALLLNNVV